MLEFINADRCKNCHDSSTATFLRHIPGGTAEFPSGPVKADRHGHYSADRYSLEQALERFAFENWRDLHGSSSC